MKKISLLLLIGLLAVSIVSAQTTSQGGGACEIKRIYFDQVQGYVYYYMYIKTENLPSGTEFGITGADSWNNLKFKRWIEPISSTGSPITYLKSTQTLNSVAVSYITARKDNIKVTYNNNVVCKQVKTCTDSDNGKNYYTKGTVTLGSESKTDSCTYCTGACQPGQECNPTCGGVVEYYCGPTPSGSGGLIKSEEYVCPNGCKDGACIEKTECYDSDGTNYFSKGYVEYKTASGTKSTEYDYCSKTVSGAYVLNEMYCYENNTKVGTKTTPCPSGYSCSDGACIRSPSCAAEGQFCGGIAGIKCCTGLKCQLEGNYPDAGGRCIKEMTKNCVDSDNGKDYYTKGTVTLGSESKTDSCTYCTGACQPGQECNPTCGGVVEYYCGPTPSGSGGLIKSEEYVCPNGCKDGACLGEAVCTDSDGGINYYVKGTALYNQYSYEDWCTISHGNGGKVSSCSGAKCELVEIYCDSTTGGVNHKFFSCPNGCQDGACITGLNDIQITACETADEAGTCDKLSNVGLVTAEQCCTYLQLCCSPTTVTLAELKDALIKAIINYFRGADETYMTVSEIKDLIVIYLTAPGDTVDLSGTGQFSGEKLIDIYYKAKNIIL